MVNLGMYVYLRGAVAAIMYLLSNMCATACAFSIARVVQAAKTVRSQLTVVYAYRQHNQTEGSCGKTEILRTPSQLKFLQTGLPIWCHCSNMALVTMSSPHHTPRETGCMCVISQMQDLFFADGVGSGTLLMRPHPIDSA